MDSRGRALGAGGDPRDVLSRSARPPDLVLRYGELADQVADVHLPPSAVGGRTATSAEPMLAIFLHGGFWRAAFGKEHTAPLAEALSAAGFAVCAPEYRRTGQAGGGWPGTMDDVAAAVDRLPGLLEQATSGLTGCGRFLLAGHSAGGHLALWAASRHRLPPASPWHATGPTAVGEEVPGEEASAEAGVVVPASEGPAAAPAVAGVVALAAVSDLAMCFERALGRQAVGDLLGGGPARLPDRYAAADPAKLLPVGIPVRMVHGDRDDTVPCDMSQAYADRAREMGDDAQCTILPGAGHFDVIDPGSDAWHKVLGAFKSLAQPPWPGDRPGWQPGAGPGR